MNYDQLEFVGKISTVLVIVSSTALSKMLMECSVDPDIETGGVLLGRFRTKDAAVLVKEATGSPADSAKSPGEFIRGTEGLDDTLQRAYNCSLQYVGEWHFHRTAEPRPSDRDRRTMMGITKSDNYHMLYPILAIVSNKKACWTIGIYRFERSGMCECCGTALFATTGI